MKTFAIVPSTMTAPSAENRRTSYLDVGGDCSKPKARASIARRTIASPPKFPTPHENSTFNRSLESRATPRDQISWRAPL
ncbi:MAG: hypothetical protein M4D80_42910 [Myxococcota bacterium]|nr:hypothetical protein [Myxococcota bacterium]